MKEYRTLRIKGAIVNQKQLEKHLEKIASDHILQNKSAKDTYPIPRMKENFSVIQEVYQILNEHIKLGIPIHPAGEWILDNLYVIEQNMKTIEKELTKKKYTNFLGIANGEYRGFARIYVLAFEIVAYTDGKIEGESLEKFLKAYQSKKTLSMDEIWNINLFLQIALIENMREIAEKIYSSQIQKYKVENIIERLVEKKEKNVLRFQAIPSYKNKITEINQMKYPFIEHMAYRLRKYGKQSYPFLEILEEEVNKIGTGIDEIVHKEHFDVAVRKVSMANSITSMKNLMRMDFLEIFEKINGVEDILKEDPAQQYERMDYKTKAYYRDTIQQIAKKTKVSEIYIAKRCLQLSKQALEQEQEINRRCHIGYYLIAEGKNELFNSLYQKQIKKKSKEQKVKKYIFTITFFTILISFLASWYLYYQTNQIGIAILSFLFLWIPTESIVVQSIQAILNQVKKPKLIPKLDFQNGIPKEEATMVVIPTILKDKKRVQELIEKLEVYSIANKSENMYFTLLGDCSSSVQEKEEWDEEVMEAGRTAVRELNQKYPEETFPKFHFTYRKRKWNEKENCYLGWERKRGLLNQCNEYLLGHIQNPFLVNTMEEEKEKEGRTFPKIKYIITLDADTDLTLNTGLELIGAMAHILNTPILDKAKNIVTMGHAMMQPRVGITLQASRKSLFTKIFAGAGGTDSYTTAISDVYQDNFEEGIFTGKGIYNVEVFSEVLRKAIPENTVLSHDLLEGCYLRCALVSDIMLMDGYPSSYQSFKTRLHRWIRGDYQIIQWLKKKVQNANREKQVNPLGLLCKYKITDNILRSLTEVMILLSGVFLITIDYSFKIRIWPIVVGLLVCTMMSTVLDGIHRIIFKKEGEEKQKTFTPVISGMWASFLRGIGSLAVLPDKAYMSISAASISLYRMCYSKKHLLEWTTSEEAEKKAKKDLFSYYRSMFFNVIMGAIAILTLFVYENHWITIFLFGLAVLWLTAPIFMWKISKNIIEKPEIEKLTEEEKKYLLEIGKRTWHFFKEHLTQRTHFLPPDNYQEDRIPKIIDRTSPTNIGLALLAVISSYDLGYEAKEDTIALLEKMINTIMSLPKWNGHLYNWYDIVKLEPLKPGYISSVDSGNFVGYLYVVKQFLQQQLEETRQSDQLKNMVENINRLIQNTDFTTLYDESKRIFSIGYNVEENKLTDSYYDLLASEARQTSLVAIAKKDVSPKHWYQLSRTLTSLNKYKGLISWSGTAFEYLMPNINIPSYPSSLLAESCQFMIMSQKEYSKKLGIPWGISEAAFNVKDLNHNYQYKAFGIPWLGLKRGLADEMVVSSYGTMLALPEDAKAVIENLKRLQSEGMYNKYGFYESIDYTPNRVEKKRQEAVVKTYMAHHQGLILLSINNAFHEHILQKRFMKNPEMRALEILLQERMPENVILTKEEKEKVEKIKYEDNQNYSKRIYHKINETLNITNVISNQNYTIFMDQKGNGYSKYKNKLVHRYKETDNVEQGILFYLKNIKTKRTWTAHLAKYLAKPEQYRVEFSPDKDEIIRTDGNIETSMKVITAPNEPVEIRKLTVTNRGLEEETLEITSYVEPVLSEAMQDYSHKAFNNLFLSCEWLEENNAILMKRKANKEKEQDLYLVVSFNCDKGDVGSVQFEIDKERFLGRRNLGLPKLIENSTPFSKEIGYSTDPIIAMKKTIVIEPEEKIMLDFVLSVSEKREEAIQNMEKYRNSENNKRTFDLSQVNQEAELRYLGITGKQVETYQEMLGYLILTPKVAIKNDKILKQICITSELWKFGISGDEPILLVKVKESNDKDVLEEVLNAYEFFRAKNIMVDLVIINEEKESYESDTKEMIQNAILNKNMGYLYNQQGGIFLLSVLEKEDKKLLEARASLIIDAHQGDLKQQMKELEEEIVEKVKEVGEETKPQIWIEEEKVVLPKEELLYDNEYGGFRKDGKEYKIRVSKEKETPTVWSHILANPHFGTVVTEGMGGYTWSENCRLHRLTAWTNSQVVDTPSEVIYLQEEQSKKTWSLGASPMPDENEYEITYGLGYAKYFHESFGIKQEVEVFIPKEDKVKVQLIHLKNTRPERKNLRLVYYIKPVLDEDEIKSNGYLHIEYHPNSNMITGQNMLQDKNAEKIYITSNEKIVSYTGSKAFFMGSGGIGNPDGLKKLMLNKEDSMGKDGIIAIELRVTIEAYANKDICLIMGSENTISNCQEMAYRYTNYGYCIQEYQRIRKYWLDLVEKLQVNTPVTSTNILLNGWMVYQIICSRMWAKTGYYQSGGAIGFRDQLQDAMAIAYLDPELSRNQIILHSKHQFKEGDVEHWWHESTSRGIRTRFSDDLLWLPFVTAVYIQYTGDYSILEEQTSYRKGNLLEENIDERYDYYPETEEKEEIYKHCIKAIEKAYVLGENGLPKIGSGDWNDGLNKVGNKGKGESVWLGFFLYEVLKRFISICEHKGDKERVIIYQTRMEQLKRALNTNGWDGRWYKRAFTDNGEVLGSLQNEECRIDSISQSWATISGAGDNDKKYISMESLENHLVDKENKIIKLLDPPFEKSKIEPGYIKSYLPGTRENGGQYTHAATWVIIAEAMLGFGDKAHEFFRMINPIEHARTKESANKYKVEPYVIAADIYGKGNLAGRGGWTWYTGSGSWMYIAGIKYILGLRMEDGYLVIMPSIPKEWEEYEIQYKWKSSIYHIKVNNPNHKTNGVERVIINGEEVVEKKIKLQDDGKVYYVEVKM